MLPAPLLLPRTSIDHNLSLLEREIKKPYSLSKLVLNEATTFQQEVEAVFWYYAAPSFQERIVRNFRKMGTLVWNHNMKVKSLDYIISATRLEQDDEDDSRMDTRLQVEYLLAQQVKKDLQDSAIPSPLTAASFCLVFPVIDSFSKSTTPDSMALAYASLWGVAMAVSIWIDNRSMYGKDSYKEFKTLHEKATRLDRFIQQYRQEL